MQKHAVRGASGGGLEAAHSLVGHDQLLCILINNVSNILVGMQTWIDSALQLQLMGIVFELPVPNAYAEQSKVFSASLRLSHSLQDQRDSIQEWEMIKIRIFLLSV